LGGKTKIGTRGVTHGGEAEQKKNAAKTNGNFHQKIKIKKRGEHVLSKDGCATIKA